MNETLLVGSIVMVFAIVCILFEAIVITVFRLFRLGKAFLASVLANFLSLTAIYFIWPIVSRMDIDEDKVFPLLPILFVVTFITEALMLWLLNKRQDWKRVALVALVMNAVSFALLYLIFSFM